MRQANILDPGFVYVPSDRTNVTLTWRRFGFEVSNAGRTDVALTWRRFGFNASKSGNSCSASHRTEFADLSSDHRIAECRRD